MGLVRKLAKRVVQGVRAVREEALHPGRPPGFKASSNPFYQAEEAALNQRSSPESKPQDPGYAPPNEATEGKPWYLKGEEADAGWDETNPGLEPGKKWQEPQS